MIEIKNIKNVSCEVHFLLIGRKWKNRQVSLPIPTLTLDKPEESPFMESNILLLDPAQKFQPDSFHFWGIPAIETASITQQFKF